MPDTTVMTAVPSSTSAENWAPVVVLTAKTVPEVTELPSESLTVTVMVLVVGEMETPWLSVAAKVMLPVPMESPDSLYRT